MTESITLFLTGTSDDATDLNAWLSGDSELRGRVRLVPAAVPTWALGADLGQLLVTLESGGMATAFASVLMAWLRRRAGRVCVKVTRPDGTEFELTAERVRELDAEALTRQIAQLAAMAWSGEDRAAGSP